MSAKEAIPREYQGQDRIRVRTEALQKLLFSMDVHRIGFKNCTIFALHDNLYQLSDQLWKAKAGIVFHGKLMIPEEWGNPCSEKSKMASIGVTLGLWWTDVDDFLVTPNPTKIYSSFTILDAFSKVGMHAVF